MEREQWAACGMPLGPTSMSTGRPRVARHQPMQAAALPPAPCSREYWRSLTSGWAPWPFGQQPDPEPMVAGGQDLIAALRANRPDVMEIRERGGQQVKIDRVRAEIALDKLHRKAKIRGRMRAAQEVAS